MDSIVDKAIGGLQLRATPVPPFIRPEEKFVQEWQSAVASSKDLLEALYFFDAKMRKIKVDPYLPKSAPNMAGTFALIGKLQAGRALEQARTAIRKCRLSNQFQLTGRFCDTGPICTAWLLFEPRAAQNLDKCIASLRGSLYPNALPESLKSTYRVSGSKSKNVTPGALDCRRAPFVISQWYPIAKDDGVWIGARVTRTGLLLCVRFAIYAYSSKLSTSVKSAVRTQL